MYDKNNGNLLDFPIGQKTVQNSNKNDSKLIFNSKSRVIKSILQNHLKLLFSCHRRNGSFLCPTRLNLLTSTPMIETSVISSQGSFVLGKKIIL